MPLPIMGTNRFFFSQSVGDSTLEECNNDDKRLRDINSCNLFDCKGLEIMLRKVKPELTIYLAEEALKKKFADESISLQEVVELQRDCRDYLSTENLRKIYARMMKVEVTKLMVEAVYQSLSSEEKEFVIMRYKKKKQLVAISLALNISVAQLVIHHHAILEKISEFMLYELSEEDVFKRQKIVSMIKLLERIIEFAEKYDSTREFINVGWLEAIEERHNRYFQMLCEIDKILNENDCSARKEIILAKMQSPYEKIEVLAERCNVDKSIVSRCLKNFVDSMKKYFE